MWLSRDEIDVRSRFSNFADAIRNGENSTPYLRAFGIDTRKLHVSRDQNLPANLLPIARSKAQLSSNPGSQNLRYAAKIRVKVPTIRQK